MESNAFPPLANAHIPVYSRILSSSCCPDKDLVILLSRLGGLDRITLWSSNQGSKIWEADIGDENTSTHVVGIAWSPDGRSVAFVLDPPRVSLHSIQDGHAIVSLPIPIPEHSGTESPRLTNVWWFHSGEKLVKPSSAIPDIFRRNNIITGSAESILKDLPLLDVHQEESEKLSLSYTFIESIRLATDIFAFQSSQTRSHNKSLLPEAINTWPTLSADAKAVVVDASIQTKPSIKPAESLDEKDDSNINSVLMVSDTLGNVYSFLDGTFPLGVVSLGQEASFTSVEKSNHGPTFFGHSKLRSSTSSSICLAPTIIDIPLLANRKTRDLARLSSIARDLTWYVMRVVKEMKDVWFGTESSTGARELGPRWVSALATKQKEQFGQGNADPILDLTWLLTTGRASEALADFLGSGEQMSERGIQKWESIMTDSLMKLRDYSEKRVAPACQRLHLVVEELQGWQQLPQFSLFQLDAKDLQEAGDLAARGIILASWLAAVVRRELFRFKEFIAWLRFENANINSPSENNASRHDILEVNNYFVSGLNSSSIDMWFEGDVPQFRPQYIGMPEAGNGPLASVLQRARQAVSRGLGWQEDILEIDHSCLQRNLVALADDMAVRCNRIFVLAAGAASRSACVHHHEPAISATEPNSGPAYSFRERIVQEENEVVENILTPVENENAVVLVQMRYGTGGTSLDLQVGVAVVECQLPEGGGTEKVEVVAADFFDNDTVVIVCRLGNKEAFLSSFGYGGIEYAGVEYEAGVGGTLEGLVEGALERWKNEKIGSVVVEVGRRRGLSGLRQGEAGLAVNGRRNRRMVCVVDSTGSRLETFDVGEETSEPGDEPV